MSFVVADSLALSLSLFLSRSHAQVLAFSNHNSDVDWLMGMCLCEPLGALAGRKSAMKKVCAARSGAARSCVRALPRAHAAVLHRLLQSAKYLPIIGWSFWFADYVFLDRNWNADAGRLNNAYSVLRSYDFPFIFSLFAEGTRITPTKLAEAQQYEREHNLPVLENVLLPRPKGALALSRAAPCAR